MKPFGIYEGGSRGWCVGTLNQNQMCPHACCSQFAGLSHQERGGWGGDVWVGRGGWVIFISVQGVGHGKQCKQRSHGASEQVCSQIKSRYRQVLGRPLEARVRKRALKLQLANDINNHDKERRCTEHIQFIPC